MTIHQRNLGFLLDGVSYLYRKRFARKLRALSLDLAQCRVIMGLAKNDDLTLTRLGEEINVSAETLARILRRMERNGPVLRRPRSSKRGALSISLTAKAEVLVGWVRDATDQSYCECFAGISASERSLLMSILESVHSKSQAAAN
jgi:DNA-binding MarR family transcriptional regulator